MESILFPVLADKYYENEDFTRAKQVCEIGLSHHENDQSGYYILGLIEKQTGNYKEAEKALLKCINHPTEHLSARLILCQVQMELERSPKTLQTHWKKVLELDPENEAAQVFVQRMEMEHKKVKQTKQKSPKKQAKAPKKKIEKKSAKTKDKKLVVKKTKKVKASKKVKTKAVVIPAYQKDSEPLKISSRLATFTMVTVLKNQGLLDQALEVLNILEEKNESKKQIKGERKAIKALISKS